MTTTKYKTTEHWGHAIATVNVDRETESSVWINGQRHAKKSSFKKYWDTWQEAHAYLLEKAEARLQIARAELQRAQGECGNIKGMKNNIPD